MPSNTPVAGFYKKDPATDGNDTFNIDTMLNQNWDKADELLGRPFFLAVPTYDAINDRIVCPLGKGIAELFNGDARVIVEKAAETTYYINAPAINTTYYLYLQADGTITHNTTGTVPAGAVLLWQVATGATVSTLTKTDRRAQISGTGAKLAAHLADIVTVPAANKIPRAGADGKLASGWIPPVSDPQSLINSIDIIKTNFKIDSHLNASKNALNQMVIDVLSDATGINASASSNYLFGSVDKILKVGYTADLTTSAQAISSGDYSTNVKGNAFDNNLGTYWGSSQLETVSGVAYIGNDFGASPKHIRRVTLRQYSTGNCVTSVKIQRSSDGVTWADVQTFSNLPQNETLQILDLPASTASRYWRLLANSNVAAGSSWAVIEVEMMESLITATVVWNADPASIVPVSAYIVADASLGTGTITYYISRDGGTTFTQCTLEQLTDISSQPSGTSIVVKVIINGDAILNAIAWGWK